MEAREFGVLKRSIIIVVCQRATVILGLTASSQRSGTSILTSDKYFALDVLNIGTYGIRGYTIKQSCKNCTNIVSTVNVGTVLTFYLQLKGS